MKYYIGVVVPKKYEVTDDGTKDVVVQEEEVVIVIKAPEPL